MLRSNLFHVLLLLLFAQRCYAFMGLCGRGVRQSAHRPLSLSNGIIDLTESSSTFDEIVLKNELPVLVDFYASWCGPCRLVEPYLKKISEKYMGKLQVVKVNTEAYKELVKEYNIYGLPVLCIFESGEEKARHAGAAGAAQMQELLSKGVPGLVE